MLRIKSTCLFLRLLYFQGGEQHLFSFQWLLFYDSGCGVGKGPGFTGTGRGFKLAYTTSLLILLPTWAKPAGDADCTTWSPPSVVECRLPSAGRCRHIRLCHGASCHPFIRTASDGMPSLCVPWDRARLGPTASQIHTGSDTQTLWWIYLLGLSLPKGPMVNRNAPTATAMYSHASALWA